MDFLIANRLRLLLPNAVRALLARLERLVGYFVPDSCRHHPDEVRRARLTAHFGLQGAVFGIAYALFYLAIGHTQGTVVILICSSVFGAVPWLMRRTEALRSSGQVLIGIMALGFTELTMIEGGIHSHAIAWLASVPLCALLILGVRPAVVWVVVCFAVGIAFGCASLCGIELVPAYDPKWRTLIDFAGNVGIILFLFALGLVFEMSRETAFDQMQASLDLLLDSNEQLTHLNNEKTEFLGIAAHDLRNPLSAIIGFADLLEMDSSAKVSKQAAFISMAGRRMLDLINDLLDANAIEAGCYASRVESVDLRMLVLTSMQHNHTSSERKEITLDLAEGPPCWAQADPKAALQILDNLISNALKYSPLGSRVSLTLQADNETVSFAIRDQGPGIGVADQKKLFLKHTKLSARPTGGESSVGLGLAIVKRLAEAMGGTVTCQSTLGEGATFILKLRAVPPHLIVMPGGLDSKTPVSQLMVG